MKVNIEKQTAIYSYYEEKSTHEKSTTEMKQER